MRTRVVATVFGLGVLWLGAMVSPASAQDGDGVAVITGVTQGVIAGDGSSTNPSAPAGAIVLYTIGFSLDVQDAQAGQVARPRVSPFKITKMPDRATPKLVRAAFLQEQLTVDITWFMRDPNSSTNRRRTFTVKLEGVRIVNMEASGNVREVGGVAEELDLVYSKITLRDERSSPVVSVCVDVIQNRTC